MLFGISSIISAVKILNKIGNFNVNEIVNIPERHFILTLHILAFPILLRF